MFTNYNWQRCAATLLLAVALAACGGGQQEAAQKAAADADAAAKAAEAAHTASLTESWNTLSNEVPGMVEAVNARVASLARTKKFPAGMTAATFETTRAAAGDMTQSWQKALGAFANSNMDEAVVSAQAAKQKGAEVMSTLGMMPSS